jgi:hypothetical protein
MADARLTYCQEQGGCRGEDHSCPISRIGSKAQPGRSAGRRVVVLSKDVAESLGMTASPSSTTQLENEVSNPDQAGEVRIHHHYARLTLDEQGQLVKLAVSR